MKKPKLSDAVLGLISLACAAIGFVADSEAQKRSDARQEEIYDAIVGKKEEE